jgi:hypothetical protein
MEKSSSHETRREGFTIMSLKYKRKSTEGVWMDYPDAKDVSFKIRPAPGFTEAMGMLDSSKTKIWVPDAPLDPVDLSKKGPSMLDAYSDGAFLWRSFDRALEDWKGIDFEVGPGEAVPSKEEVKHAIYDDDNARNFILKQSRQLLEDQNKKLEEERKNSLS